MITLNGTWQMNCKGEDSWQEGQVPGTVYTDLLRNGQMKDPYVGENEDEVRDLSYNDYTYRRTFEVEEKTLQNTKNVLVCEGLDTLADVYLNGTHMGSCENMHRTYRFDVTELLKAGTNEIAVELHSPLKYMEEQYEKRPLWGCRVPCRDISISGKRIVCSAGTGVRSCRILVSGAVFI